MGADKSRGRSAGKNTKKSAPVDSGTGDQTGAASGAGGPDATTGDNKSGGVAASLLSQGASSTNKSKNQTQTVFNLHLTSLGATRDEIKRINETINELVSRAQIKQEDMTDKISLLKKLEIKFHQLVEMRKVFDFFDPNILAKQEKKIRDIIFQRNYENRQKRAKQFEIAQAAKTLQKIEKKKQLKVVKNIRNAERSKKPELEAPTTETQKTPPAKKEFRKYLGQMPENFENEMFKHQ